MKHLSQIANKVFTHKPASSFPKSQDQKTLERQKGELDSFMLSFSSHEQIVEAIHKTLFEIFKARNLSGMPIRDLRVDEFNAGLKDGWRGTFGDRTTLLEGEIDLVIDGGDRDRVCGRVVELLNAAVSRTISFPFCIRIQGLTGSPLS
jgi:hypothetical protein